MAQVQEALEAAVARGFVTIQIFKIAQQAGVSESTVRLWVRGKRVKPVNENAIRRALGLKETAVESAK